MFCEFPDKRPEEELLLSYSVASNETMTVKLKIELLDGHSLCLPLPTFDLKDLPPAMPRRFSNDGSQTLPYAPQTPARRGWRPGSASGLRARWHGAWSTPSHPPCKYKASYPSVKVTLSITYNVTERGMVLPTDNVTEGELWPQ